MRSGTHLNTLTAPGRAIKVNYNSACDLERFEKFKCVIMTLSEVRKLARLFAITIKEMPNIIPTSSVSIFVITPNMILNRQLVDFKLELGRNEAGELLVADEISPDTCRLWDMNSRDEKKRILDKDRFRQDLGGVIEAYGEVCKRVQGATPKPRNYR